MNAAAPGPTVERNESVLLIVDLQARLMPAIADSASVVAKTAFLAKVASRLGVPILVTEQNPAGLGRTVPELSPYAGDPFEKRCFNACRAPGFFERLPPGRRMFLVAGAEAHVCVLQTALGLMSRGFSVGVVGDAIGSRYPADKQAAIRRLQEHGAEIVNAEMVAFEWLDSADDPEFRSVIALVKEL